MRDRLGRKRRRKQEKEREKEGMKEGWKEIMYAKKEKRERKKLFLF